MPSGKETPHLPGERWFHGLRNPVVRTGLLSGVYLIIVMVAAVLLANHAPWLEKYADQRNWASRAAFVLTMLLPIVLFRRSAVRLFVAGILGWFLATLAYLGLGFYFEDLWDRLNITPAQFFMRGAMVYGVAAVIVWVIDLILATRHRRRHDDAFAARRRDL